MKKPVLMLPFVLLLGCADPRYEELVAQEAARRERRAAEYEARRAEEEARRAAEHEARRARYAEEAKARAESEALAREAREREYNERRAEIRAAQLAAEKEREPLMPSKAKCGKDYMQVRIGMPFARVHQCAGPFSRAGEVSRPDGVVYIYRQENARGGLVYVIDGKVVAWHASGY